MKWDFNGFLGPHLAAYHELKVRLGYTSFRELRFPRDMDQFTTYRYLSSFGQLDERFIWDWIHLHSKRAGKTKNRMLTYARGFFDYLVRQRLITNNPALKVLPVKEKQFRPHIYSLHEIHQILQEASLWPGALGRTFPVFLLLLYACGLRNSEARKLRIRDVDFDENMLLLFDTKFHKERLVPFSTTMSAKLKTYLAFRRKTFPTSSSNAPFFCHHHGALAKGTIQGTFHKILVRCGLRPLKGGGPRLHDFRHTFAIHRLYKWYQEGHDVLNKLPMLSTYMGHVSLEGTQIYLSATQALLREGDKRFQAGFEDIANKSLRRVFH